MNATSCCPTCGAKRVEYTHRLSKGLASALARAYEVHGLRAFNPSIKLGLTHTQLANWQKLRYWGLIKSSEKGGQWQLTYSGARFLMGDMTVALKVKTYRGEPLPFKAEDEIAWVSIGELLPDYGTRASHAQEATPKIFGEQRELF